jgi:hypothetical protein
MKNKLITIALVVGSMAQAQQFNGTAINTTTGQVQIVTGFVDCGPTSRPTIVKECDESSTVLENLRATRLRIQADTDRVWAEIAASRAQAQLEEQTRLLRKIANE